MAVGFDAKPTAYNSADGLNQEAVGATSISAASGMSVGGSATLLTAQLCFGANTSSPPTNVAMTWNSTSMTKEIQQDSSSADNATSVQCSLRSPATGVKTLAASWTGALDVYMSCASFTDAEVNTSGTTSNTQSLSLAINTTSDGATVACFASNGATPTPTQTKIWAEAPNPPGGGGSYAIGGSGTNTHTFTSGTGSRQAITGLQLWPVQLTTINATPGTWTWAGSSSPITRGPETAFQQNAFQSNVFQIYGGSTGGVTTINQTIGTWTWAGSTASIAVQQVNQPTGTWTWAGSTQGFTQLINQITGTWTWTGSSSIAVPQINQTTGTWSWVGSTASIPVQQVNQTTGAWTWAGSTQSFTQLVNQVTGTWTWAGTTQQITTPGGATTIDQVTGTWNWAGIQSTLDPQSINATVGTWSWTGAQSIESQSIDSTPGLWTWSGSQAEIISQITIDITPGLWDWAGTQATLTSEAIDLGGGAPGKRRYRKRFQVEIDGEVFEVRSEEEALTLLRRVKDLAEQKVSEVVKRSFDNIDKPIRRPKRKVLNDARRALVAPEITSSRWVSDSAQSISIEIGDLYKEALKTIEIGVLMRINAELDDEEAILLLL